MIDEHKQDKSQPVAIIQAVSSIAMAEAILLSKSLGDSSAASAYGPSARTNASAATARSEKIRSALHNLILISGY